MARCTFCGKFSTTKGKDGAPGCKCTVKFCKTSPSKEKGPARSQSREDVTVALQGVQMHEGADTSPELDVAKEMRLFRAELRGMREELTREIRDLRREVGDLRGNIAACETRMLSLEDRVKELENSQTNAEDLEKSVSQLKMELNDRDQELLASDIEISNLPEDTGENALHLVEAVARKLGVELESRDVVFAERVGLPAGQVSPAGAGRPRRLVVRLARRALRDELLRSARVRRGATSADLGLRAPARRFFLNERLNRQNKVLFYKVRQAASNLGWRYAWTSRGRILARQAEGKPTHSIRNEADLLRVFGPNALHAPTD